MRLTAWLLLAVLSGLATAGAATHPQYGGTLRVETPAAPASLDAGAPGPWASLVYEPMVRLEADGTPRPWLALAWQREGNGKRWQFKLRPGVKLQDGSPLTAATAATLLEAALQGVALAADGDTLRIRADHGLSSLLLDLAGSNCIPAGPFRLTAFDAGRHATFAANEDYWGGRPFVDRIDVQLGRALRDQFADLELGKADVVELAPADLRRAAEHGRAVWTSAPIRLIALAAQPGRMADPRLCEALAFSIDRAAMHSVLLQKQGEVTAALLPQWISGYAFAFPVAPDLLRARALVAALAAPARAITLSYDPAMPAARMLVERVAVNARDAGLAVEIVSPRQPADVRLIEMRVHDFDAPRVLAGFASGLALDSALAYASLQAIYESERRLLEDFRVIPLFHLPDLYGAAGRVRLNGEPAITRLGDWRFEDLWLAGTAP